MEFALVSVDVAENDQCAGVELQPVPVEVGWAIAEQPALGEAGGELELLLRDAGGRAGKVVGPGVAVPLVGRIVDGDPGGGDVFVDQALESVPRVGFGAGECGVEDGLGSR
ncbi:hypothetical protein ACFFQW_03265 [Umezawaea endophytica]|uniref:Uncharacterized protein n=1 Tax=Umezawaea endophytica TaxID=1654476 RepID=A0A9X2VNC9_9PSEU|nr:hypothetical protein [Umezawaea endophytica]MCS7479167.1 hypothetical protein [Umezawaea endophytica]